MKLKDVKQKIDNYFDNICPEELYELAVSKYGFSEVIIENSSFETENVCYYSPSSNSTYNNDDCKDEIDYLLAA